MVTIVKRGFLPGKSPPPSRLRLKGVCPGTQPLLGPRKVNFTFGSAIVPWNVYEADIDDTCLLGADFIYKYKVHIDPDTEEMRFRPSPDESQVSIPFQWERSASNGQFDSGRVFYQMRAGKNVALQPFDCRTISARLLTDHPFESGDLSPEERLVMARSLSAVDSPSDDGATPAPNGSTNIQSESVPCGSRAASSPDTADSLPYGLDEAHLGLITSPLEIVPNRSKLPDHVVVRSGVITCISAPVDIEIMNVSSSWVQLPRNVVIAEVYLLNPLSYSYTAEENEKTQEFVQARMTKLKEKETYNEYDAEIDPNPKLPPIPPDKPLPADLQDLIDRCDGLTDTEKRELETIIRIHHDIFAKDDLSFGKCPWMQFRIDTGDHPPIKQKARPIPLHYRQAVRKQFLKYLECGTVVPSNSAWASPILCVLKKTGEVRVCIDYRRLNAVTNIPARPIPRIQDLLEKLAGKKWYTHTDVAWGYHNVEIHPDDRCKTAVILPDDLDLPSRQFEFTRLSFGLSAAPGQFQAITDKLIRPAQHPSPENDLGQAVGVYLDDVCVGADDFQSMLQKIVALFNRLRAAGLLLKAKKCFLFQKALKFLGHKISEEGISQDEEKTDKIVHWPTPQNVNELHTWLGMVTYYLKFIRNLATVAAPLYNLLHHDVKFQWTPECQEAFSKIKTILTTAPVLGVPDLSQGEFILDCDASQKGIGAVLSQSQNGMEKPLSFWSKTLNKAQKNYCTTHLELLSLVEGVLHFHQYLAGAPFIIRTDHASLQWLRSFKNPTGKLSRWIEKLAPYQFTIRYRRGQEQGNADAMSRRPSRPCATNCKTCMKMEKAELRDETHSAIIRWAKTEATWMRSDEIHKAQLLDPHIMPIFMAVEEGKRPPLQDVIQYGPITRSLWLQFNSLEIRDNMLQRRYENPSGLSHLHTYQVVLPENKVLDVAKKIHESPGSGNHFGVSRTYKLFKRMFYWPQASEIIREVIQSCEKCCKFKGPHKKNKAPLKLFREGTLFGRWHVDLAGPFRPTSKGHRYIVVAVEAFSGWPCTIPIKEQTAEEIARALVDHVFSFFGAPLAVKTDQGSPLEAKLFKEVMKIYGVEKMRTTRAHPSANGKVERYIKTLKKHLAMMVNENHDDWDQ